MLRIQRGAAIGRQCLGPRRIGGIDHGGGARLDLVQCRPLAHRRFGGIVALQQRIALHLLLDEGVHLDIGELQELDGLTQLRRHDQGLALA